MQMQKVKIKPMLLTESPPFDSADYIFELKLDGIRTIAVLCRDETRLYSRNGRDMTSRFPELSKLHESITNGISKATDDQHTQLFYTVLDGEIIALTNGKPDFNKLLRGDRPIQYVAFDILFLHGEDLKNLPLDQRKTILESSVTQSAYFVVCEYIDTHGKALFELARRENLEGIVAKNKTSVYHEGIRTTQWLKIRLPHKEVLLNRKKLSDFGG